MIVEFVLAAELELDEAVAYFNAQRSGLGVEFAREVNAAIQRIVQYPNVWQRLAGGVRRCQLRRFEYGLVYRVLGDVVIVYAVMHLKRRPGYWRDRLKTSHQR
jgi:hypothetical protein